MHQALMEHKALVDIIAPSPADSPPVPKSHLPLASKAARELVELPIHDDVALPIVDVLRIPPATQPVSLTSDEPTISVEVFAVAGGTTTPITTDFHIFYDEEVRAIIHRYKVKTSGLVSTRVFGWRGRQAEVGASEAKKLGELASRFGTTLIPCIQGSEPLELVRILGNTLVTRQGPRAHWTAENTAMHCVRQVKGAIYIDQVEPERKNLCSAFSYVATVLDAIFVFHGKGATQSEREAALKYAQSISPPNREPVEFEESHEDEMFTMVLGEEQHAMADFWRFRSAANDCAAVLYRVDSDQSPPVQRLNEVAAECLEPGAVFVLDGTFEVFVIVGADARGYRKDIRLAISVAQQLAALQAAKRPFTPPVHVLILPSQVPMDLRVGHVRFLDEELLNSGDIPNHMNLIPLSEAFEQLSKSAWPRGLLEDPSFLPLGVSPDDIPIQS
ncbi:hypothetical protein FRB99_001247 [Tulasnella sp. 403]|nr:hypothetical protein FRB99_001247 [Tulasnella sp. 403]